MLRTIYTSLLRQSSASSGTIQNVLQFKGIRPLYTIQALGIDAYCSQRMRVGTQFSRGPEMRERFFTRMESLLSDQNNEEIYAEDLKTVLNLAENSDREIDIINKMVEKYHSQHSIHLNEGNKTNFIFGPVIMRFFHHLNKPRAALQLIQNPETMPIFDQFISYQILMDSLLNNQMYEDVLAVFSQVQERNIKGAKFPKNCFVLAATALYRMNTAESLQKAESLLTESKKLDVLPLRRVLTYCAMLALKQNQPETALEMLSNSNQQNYITVRNQKVLALARLGNFTDTIAILRSGVYSNDQLSRQRTTLKDVMSEVGRLLESSGQKDYQLEFERVSKLLRDGETITNQSLEELVDLPIAKKDGGWTSPDTSVNDMFQRSPGVTNFKSNRSQSRKRVPDRLDLGEMD